MPVPILDTYDLNSSIYMAWNRIEGRPRKKQFDSVLKAEIHDPLWMLGRQWQMGEFTGNDTGSGIFARLQMDYAKINGFSTYDGQAEAYDPETIPLEPIVERVNYNWSIKERVFMGKKWLSFLEAQVSSSNFSSYKTALLANTALTIDLAMPTSSTTPESDILTKSEIFSDKKVYSFLAAMAVVDNIIDGGTLFNVLYRAGSSAAGLSAIITAPFNLSFDPGDTAAVTVAITDFVKWARLMYTLPEIPPPGLNVAENWKKEALEYQFDTYFPTGQNTTSTRRLSVQDYHQGSFDWYAFMQHGDEADGNLLKVKSMQILMSEARFPGMPVSRWWEFENGGVNFCQIDGNTTDIAKILMTQFALVYQDDWFVVPYKIPNGSYSNVRGIVVTDVFGIRTFVKNYTHKYNTNSGGFEVDDATWKRWRWMDIGLHASSNVVNSVRPAGKLLMPPTSSKTIEGKPLESVVFIRDEMSNMVWGIEKTVPNHLGRGTSGADKAYAILNYLKTIKTNNNSTPASADPEAKAIYKLVSTDIPENWIPFVPVAASPSSVLNRSIKLQRSAMPRMLQPYAPALVRPRTEILRYGINNANVATTALYINEEEVPRSGAVVETSFQRCRWYDGKVYTWVGRRKTTGRGEGSSRLEYDTIQDIPSS